MRNYQPTKNNPYLLAHNLRMSMIYLIRDYDRLCKEAEDILNEIFTLDGQPRRDRLMSWYVHKEMQLAENTRICDAIKGALLSIPKEYRQGIFDNIRYGTAFPLTAGTSTYSRWKSRYIYLVAKNLWLI